MLVTITNVSGEQVFISTIYQTLEDGGSVEFSRTALELDREIQLKQLLSDSDVTMTLAVEDSDSVATGFSPVLLSYTNALRPAATAIPALTMIWNSDDNAINLSDGSSWRDAAGNVT